MLNSTMISQIKPHLAQLNNAVELVVFSDNSAKAKELETLAYQLTEISDLLTLSVEQQGHSNERYPSLLIRSVEKGTEVRFAGVPMGHEFTSLILALLQQGGHPLKISAEEIEQIKALEGEYTFETFISLSCQNCPDVVQALNLMASINPAIKPVMIDGAVFADEAEQRNVLSVPAVYLNGEAFSQGRVTLSDILTRLDTTAPEKQRDQINQKDPFDVLIVGGGPAGAAAAIYSARKGIRTGIVADRFGGQVLDTMAIENFISVKATEGPKLVAGLEEHVNEYDVDIMKGQRAANISKPDGENGPSVITLENGATLTSKSVIVATGARWREMNVPGEQEYRGKGVAYCPHCDGPLFKGKPVAVIGGGNSGIEAAIDLAGIVSHVTVLEFADTLRADEVLVQKARSMGNVTIITEAQTTEVLGNGNKVTGLTYLNRATGDSHELTLDGIFVQIGLLPNSDFLRETVEQNRMGEIIINERNETSLPGVFAAGDVTNVPYKQIIIAMGGGATASLSAFDYLIRQG